MIPCAGPGGSVGFCGGECCSGATDVCVDDKVNKDNNGANAEACCAIH